MRILNHRDALVVALADRTGLPYGQCWAAVNVAATGGSLSDLHNADDVDRAAAEVEALLEPVDPARPALGPPALAYTPPPPFEDVPLKERVTISGDSRAWPRDLRAGLRDQSMQVRAKAASQRVNRPFLNEVTDIKGVMLAQAIAEHSTDSDQLHAAAEAFEEFFDTHRGPHQHLFYLLQNVHTSAATLELVASRFLRPDTSRTYDKTTLWVTCNAIPTHPNCPPALAATLRDAFAPEFQPRGWSHPTWNPWHFPTEQQRTDAADAAAQALAGTDVKARAAAAADPATPASALTELARDRTVRVRATVARNEAATVDVLLQLADDQAPLVQIGLADNGGAPPAAVRSARLAKRAHWGRLLDLAAWAAGQPLDDAWQEAVIALAPSWPGNVASLVEHLAGTDDSTTA